MKPLNPETGRNYPWRPQDINPRREQGELFGGSRPRPNDPILRNVLKEDRSGESYSLARAAKIACLSEDTLRRAIARGDLDAQIVVDRGQEIYRITRENLSLYLLWRTLPRKRKMMIREKREAAAIAQRVAPSSSKAAPIHLDLHERIKGRSVEAAVARYSEQPTALMRTPNAPIITPRSSIYREKSVVGSNPDSAQTRIEQMASRVERRILELEAEVRSLQTILVDLRGAD